MKLSYRQVVEGYAAKSFENYGWQSRSLYEVLGFIPSPAKTQNKQNQNQEYVLQEFIRQLTDVITVIFSEFCGFCSIFCILRF